MIFVSVFSLAAYYAYAKGAHSGGHGGGHHVKPAASGHKGHVHPHPGPGPRPHPHPHPYHHVFNRNWWAGHPYIHNNYWHNNVWRHRPWGYWWGPATWVGLSSWMAWNWGSPRYYNYGSNFYYSDDNVYQNGKRLGSAAEYYDQAVAILEKAPKIADNKDQWMSLGVFAVSRNADKPSNKVLQLAVNKEGVIQGTYYNMDKDKARPISGMVDKKSQRAVWTFADNKKNSRIMETGIANLTKNKTSMLVHLSRDKTETWQMIRLKKPPDEEAPDSVEKAQ